MKKLLTSFVLVLVLVCAFAVVSYAADVYVNGAAYGNNLSEAIKKAPTDGTLWKIELKADYTTSSGSYSQAAGTNIELDLGGNLLKCTSSSNPFFYIKSNFKVYNGTIETTGTGNVFNVNTAGGNLILDKDLTINTAKSAVAYCDVLGCSVTINDGTYTRADGTKLFIVKNVPLTVNGGVFNSDVNEESTFSDVITLSSNVGSSINGGTFPVAVDSNFIADGYECVKNNDGTYSVVLKTEEKITADAVVSALYDDGKGENTVTKRFFALIDSDQYASAGFEIVADGFTYDIKLDEIYSAVNVNNTDYVADGGYILTGAIGDVPNDFDGDFDVKVYTITFEGIKTYR